MKPTLRPTKFLLLTLILGLFLIFAASTSAQTVERFTQPIVSPAGLKVGDVLKPGVDVITGKRGFAVLNYRFTGGCHLIIYIGENKTYRVLKEETPNECFLKGLNPGHQREIELKDAPEGTKKIVIYGSPMANASETYEVIVSLEGPIREHLTQEGDALARLKNELSTELGALQAPAAMAGPGDRLSRMMGKESREEIAPRSEQAAGSTLSATGAAATPSAPVSSRPSLSLLGIPAFELGADKEIKVNLYGALADTGAKLYIKRLTAETTDVIVRFARSKNAPAGKKYVAWAVSPERRFIRLGQFKRVDKEGLSEVRAETTLPDFGLLITVEDEYDSPPTGSVVATGGH
jgi:hypothetical protein